MKNYFLKFVVASFLLLGVQGLAVPAYDSFASVGGSTSIEALTEGGSCNDDDVVTWDASGEVFQCEAAPGAAGGDSWSDPVDSDIIPDTDDTYDLGSAAAQFKDGFFDGTLEADAITLGGTALGSIYAPIASPTFTGDVIVNTASGQFGDEMVSIFNQFTADGSSVGAIVAETDLNMTGDNTTSIVTGGKVMLTRTYGAGTPTDTTTIQAGLTAEVDLAGSGTLTNTSAVGVTGLFIGEPESIGGGTLAVSNYSGIHIQASTLDTGTDKVGIRIGDQSGATNNYSIFTGTGLVHLGNLTASTVPYTDASQNLVSSDVTPTELDHLDGVTSGIQAQLDGKAPSDGDGIVDAICGHIEEPSDKAFFLVLNAPYPFTINSITTDVDSGTAAGALEVEGTPVTGCTSSDISISSTEATDTCTAGNTVATGNDLELVISSNSAADDLRFCVNITRD